MDALYSKLRGSPGSKGSQHPSSHTDKEEPSWTKFIFVPGLVLNTVVSAIILVGLEKDWTISGNAYRRIDNARATTQIVVQVVAALLGAIYVQTIATVINYATRLVLTRWPVSLDRLKLFQSLSMASLDWSTKLAYLPLVLGFCVAALVPSALWAGALTPVKTWTTSNKPTAIELAQYTNNSYSLWSQSIIFNNEKVSVSNPKGTFSYLPYQDRFGYLIQDGSAASSVNGQPQLHVKNDNSNFTFIGRSYGVGSSAGLTDGDILDRYGAASYQYTETGYHSEVECIFNSSSQWGLILVSPGRSEQFWRVPSIYLATGPGPNTTRTQSCANGTVTDCGGIMQVGLYGSEDIVAASWWASAESGLAYMGLPNSTFYLNKTRPVLSKAFTALTAGSSYQNLNNTQCSIAMIPTSFSVDVNVLDRTISVSPQNGTNATDIEPSGFIADSASSVLGVMSGIDTSLFTSILGTMLQRNIANIQQQQNITTSTQDTTLRGVAECLEALIDDYLLATASSQLIIANDTYSVVPTVSIVAFHIGQRAYAIAVIVLNAVVVIVFIAEVFRTRGWNKLPKFNYTDVKNVTIASSLGGPAIGDAVLRSSCWTGDSSDRAAGAIMVVLRPEQGVVLRLPNDFDAPNGENIMDDVPS